MNYTPGPWKIVGGTEIRGTHRIICNTADWRIPGDDSAEDDARLIAAAPDLLAALESLNAAVIRAGYGNTAMPELTQAWAAIARATGEVDHVVD